MPRREPASLPIAVRVFPSLDATERNSRSGKQRRVPGAMLVFDTETRIDATQRLTFGSFRFIQDAQCLEEGMFYADDLPAKDRHILERYAATHNETVDPGARWLGLLTGREFVDKLYRDAYKARCLLVGFNLPFDLSRIACDSTTARGRFAGGFSLGLWSYVDKKGRQHQHPYRPRIGIKQIDRRKRLAKRTDLSEAERPRLDRALKVLANAVQIVPDGDVLPSRARYSIETNDWQVHPFPLINVSQCLMPFGKVRIHVKHELNLGQGGILLTRP